MFYVGYIFVMLLHERFGRYANKYCVMVVNYMLYRLPMFSLWRYMLFHAHLIVVACWACFGIDRDILLSHNEMYNQVKRLTQFDI